MWQELTQRGAGILLAVALGACTSHPPSSQFSATAAATDRSETTAGIREVANPDHIVRLDPRAAATAQRIELWLDPASTRYRGSATIDVAISEPVPEILFHAQGHHFESFTLTGPGGVVAVDVEREDRQGLVRTRADEPLPAGEYRLGIDFTQDYNTKAVGLYRTEYQGRPYVFSQLQAIDGRRAFPCWDEPGVKIPYQLTISAPADNVVVTNTPAVATETVDGWNRTEFAVTPPMPSYLLAIAVGEFDSLPVPDTSIPARILTVPGFAHLGRQAAEMTAPILNALEDYFGRAYPYQKLDQIAVPEFWPGAMENAGLITYADRILLLEDNAGSRKRRRLAQVMAHEFAHMWFGDLVTMQWWDDLWLNESFAAWMENKIPQQLYPELRSALSGRTATQDVMVADARPSARPVRRTVETSHDIFADIGVIYEKGAGVLSMVEQWLGEEAFREGVRGYIDRHAWGNATADDFWAALSEASGEDVASILAGFVLRPGLPLVRIEERDGVPWLVQERFRPAGVQAEEQTWKIPITLKYRVGDEVGQRGVLLTEPEIKLDVPSGVDWILPDAAARGYYRWVIPDSHMRQLAESASEVLSARERASILDNAGALLDAGLMRGSQYVRLLETFASDPDPDVLSRVLDGVEKVGDSFVTDDNRHLFASYVRATLKPIATRLGWERVEGEIETTHTLRRRLFQILGHRGDDPRVRELARGMTRDFLRDRSTVDPELASEALRIAAIDGDEALYEAFRERFENPESPQDRGMFLAAMAHFDDPALRTRRWAYSLSEEVKSTEITVALRGGGTDAEAMERMAWILDHYDGFESKISTEFLAFMPRTARGCSRERLELATEFFSEPENQVAGTLTNLQQVTEQVNQCLTLREREGEEVNDYLEQYR